MHRCIECTRCWWWCSRVRCAMCIGGSVNGAHTLHFNFRLGIPFAHRAVNSHRLLLRRLHRRSVWFPGSRQQSDAENLLCVGMALGEMETIEFFFEMEFISLHRSLHAAGVFTQQMRIFTYFTLLIKYNSRVLCAGCDNLATLVTCSRRFEIWRK